MSSLSKVSADKIENQLQSDYESKELSLIEELADECFSKITQFFSTESFHTLLSTSRSMFNKTHKLKLELLIDQIISNLQGYNTVYAVQINSLRDIKKEVMEEFPASFTLASTFVQSVRLKIITVLTTLGNVKLVNWSLKDEDICIEARVKIALQHPDSLSRSVDLALIFHYYFSRKRWGKAEEIATLKPKGNQQRRKLVDHYVKVGAFAKAEEIAKSISKIDRTFALQSISEGYIERKNLDKAGKIALSISEEIFRASALEKVVIAYTSANKNEPSSSVRMKNLVEAEKLANEIGSSHSEQAYRSTALEKVVDAFLEDGKFEKAREIAKTISSQLSRADAYRLIEQAKLRALQSNQNGDAGQMRLEESHSAARYFLPLAEVTRSIEKGNLLTAERRARNIPDRFDKSSSLFEIVEAYIKTENLEKAQEIARSIPSELYRSDAFEAIDRARSNVVQSNQNAESNTNKDKSTEKKTKESSENTNEIEDVVQRSADLLSKVYTAIKEDNLDKAEEIAKSIPLEGYRIEALQALDQAPSSFWRYLKKLFSF